MADNTQLNTNTTSGDTIRTLEDGSSIKWPVGVTAYATTVGTPDVIQIVTTAAGLPIKIETGGSIPVTDNSGSLTVDNAGTFAVQVDGSALTSLQLLDDVVATAGSAALTKGNQVAGTDGTNARIISVTSAGLVNIADGGGSLTVDGTVAVTNTGLTDLAGAISDNGSVRGLNFPVMIIGGNGASGVQELAFADASGIKVAGQDIHDAGASAGPLLVGGYASATAPTAVSTDGDAVRLWADLNGRLQIGDGAGSITVDNGGTFAVQAAQSGTWNIGTVTTVSTVTNVATIGTSVTPGTGATNLGKAEDAVHSTGDVGVMALAVRSNTAASTSGADGDYQPLITNTTGHLWVDASGQTLTVASHAVTNAGTFAVQPAGSVAHDGLATSVNPVLAGFYASAAAPTDVSGDGDSVRAWALRSGALATQPTYAGVLAVAGNGASGTGVQRVTLANDSTGVLATVSTVTTVSTLTGSGIAHDAADSGNPHKIGAKATTALSGITAVANADRTDLYAGADGVLIVRPDCNLEDVVQERTTNTDGASTAFASGLGAPGAGVRLWIKNVTLCNSSATFCTVDLRDGSAGSVLWTLPVPATGGVTHTFDPPLKLTANTALAFDASAATSTLTISANGFKSKL